MSKPEAMTEEEREEFGKHVQHVLNYRARGLPLSNTEIHLLKAAEHIAVLNKRNFNLANERQRLENGIEQVIKKAKREAWFEGHQAGYRNTGLNNPYDDTKVDGE